MSSAVYWHAKLVRLTRLRGLSDWLFRYWTASLVAVIAVQETKVSELSLAVEAHKKEAVAVKEEVKGEYATTEKELRAEFDAGILKMKGEYEEFSNKTKTAATEHLKELNSKEEQAKTILSLI